MSAVRLESDRRQYSPEQSELWSRLNLSQQFSAGSLSQYGYTLTFIRRLKSNDNLIIMLSQNKVATINNEGEIDINSDITIRY